MHRWVVLLVLAACEAPVEPDAVPPLWVYPPAVAAWPLGEVTATIGRSQPPQYVMREGVSGKLTTPLRLPTLWAVPGDGAARAAVYGLAGDAPAVELIDIDAGTITWRDTTTCAGPIVGVSETTIVCAGADGTTGLGLDGKRRWRNQDAFIAMTEERVVIASGGEALILDADTGNELARVKLPVPAPPRAPAVRPARAPLRPGAARPGAPRPVAAPPLMPIAVESIMASCGDAGRELFAYGADGRLVRIAEAPGGPRIAWATPVATIGSLEACDGPSVLVTTMGDGGTTLVSLARDSGKVLGTLGGVRGVWPARDGSARLEVATNTGVAVWGRELVAPPEPTALPALGELLAKRGERRLVRATPLTAVLLDKRGVQAYVPLAQLGAALGDRTLVAASWLGSPGENVHRIAIPPRYARGLRVPAAPTPVAVTAELRDLPAVVDVDANAAIAKPDSGKHAVLAMTLDPLDANVGYAAMLEEAENEKTGGGVARFDLAARAWTWYRSDGCGPGAPIALAASRTFLACAARSGKTASVYATTREGSPLWQWRGDNVDAIAAAVDIVLVFDADRLHVLDGRDGSYLASYASDDGAAMRAAALDIGGMPLVVMYQRGRVVARLPRVDMVPAWTIAVAGVVRGLVPAGDGVLVELEDGDAYRIDARTAAPVAVAGIDLTWSASGNVIVGQASGGPVPQPKPKPVGPVRPRAPVVVRRGPPPPPRDPNGPPVLPKAWPAPPPMPASWQLTLYELTGGLRARNDYALAPPITPATQRAPGETPIVVQSGPGLRDVLVLDPKAGDPLRRVHLPDDAAPGLAFSTIVDGKPVVGTLLANPLRVVVF